MRCNKGCSKGCSKGCVISVRSASGVISDVRSVKGVKTLPICNLERAGFIIMAICTAPAVAAHCSRKVGVRVLLIVRMKTTRNSSRTRRWLV